MEKRCAPNYCSTVPDAVLPLKLKHDRHDQASGEGFNPNKSSSLIKIRRRNSCTAVCFFLQMFFEQLPLFTAFLFGIFFHSLNYFSFGEAMRRFGTVLNSVQNLLCFHHVRVKKRQCYCRNKIKKMRPKTLNRKDKVVHIMSVKS